MAFVQNAWWCEACKAYGIMPGAAPVDPVHDAKVKKLLLWSHVLGWGGLGVMLLGPVGGALLAGGAGAVAVGGFGLIACVVGAVIGQVARGMQGRVI